MPGRPPSTERHAVNDQSSAELDLHHRPGPGLSALRGRPRVLRRGRLPASAKFACRCARFSAPWFHGYTPHMPHRRRTGRVSASLPEMRDFTIQGVLKPRERRRKIVAALPQSFPKRACESGLSSFCQKRPWVIVLTTWARLRFTKGSNDARPDRRTTSFGYCIRTQKGATGRHYDGG
jgi:hypothetical protein